jgi:hypothetical protein
VFEEEELAPIALNHDGVALQRGLGPDAEVEAAKITSFDSDGVSLEPAAASSVTRSR